MEEKRLSEFLKENGEEAKVEDSKQEFHSITLNGIEYNLIPKEISVRYIQNWYDKDMKAETTEEYLKRKFETNKYICIMKDIKLNNWVINILPSFYQNAENTIEYKLIKKEHKEIFEAYLKDNTLKIQYRWDDEDWRVLDDFIENYDENMQLRIFKKEFEPFTLNIEVNTIDEAKSLWNRFNLNYNILCEAIQDKYYEVDYENRLCTSTYWKQLENILKDLGEEPDVKG